MEEAKRKRRDDGDLKEKRGKLEEDDGDGDEGQTVTEGEVEEFFAILRRIHVAVKYFEKGNGEGRELTAKRWRPSFELKDFEVEDDNSVVDGGKAEESGCRVEGPSGLDLNADPNIIEDPV